MEGRLLGSAGQPGVGSSTRDLKRQLKGGSRNGSSLSVGAPRGEPGGGAPLLGPLKHM